MERGDFIDVSLFECAMQMPATVAELLKELGDISAERILLHPSPGTATVKDVQLLCEKKDFGLFELIDGTLVRKAFGFRESVFTGTLLSFVYTFVKKNKLGVVVGPNAMLKFGPCLVRLPDLSFIAWDQFPGKKIPEEPVPTLFPNLAADILRPGNTGKEMLRKRQDYFSVGSKLVWLIDPNQRLITVYDSVTKHYTLSETDTLDGGSVLPGFTLALRDLFAELDSHPG